MEEWKLQVRVSSGMMGCISKLAEKRRLSGGGMPSLGVLFGVIRGVKSLGRSPRRLCFFHPLCDGWLVVVLPPKLHALINTGCSRGTTHASLSWHLR
jgi:hypothetical protein